MSSNYSVVGETFDELTQAYKDAEEWVRNMTDLVRDRVGEEAAAQTAANCMHYIMHIMSGAGTYNLGSHRDHPVIEKFISYTGKNFATQNADASYQMMKLHGDYSYKITGSRGTCSILDISVYGGQLWSGEQKFVSSLGRSNFELPIGPDVEIKLSREPQDGVWLALPEGEAFAIIRQYHDDWDNDESGKFQIERTDMAYPEPARDQVALVRENAKGIRDFLAGILKFSIVLKSKMLALELNTLPEYVFPAGDFVDIRYTSGIVSVKPGEAAIIEYRPPETRYWSTNTADIPGNVFHPHLRQCSLNHRQAVVDADGVFRGVLAHEDPGVPNWIDAAGHLAVVVQSRFYRAPVPETTVKIVPLADLRKHLPAETPVVTREERDQIIRKRLASAVRRGLVDL